MGKYKGSIELISGLKQANNQDFPLMDASAIQVDDEGTRLDEALKNVGKDKRKGKQRQVGKACLWYHTLDDYGNTDDEAAATLASNDIVVAGGALYGGNYTEETANRQIAIIKKAKKLNPNFKIFFYITIASWRNDGGWSHILGKGGYWDAEEAEQHPNAVRIHTKWEIYQLLEYAAHAGGRKSGERQFIETYTWTDDAGVEHTEDKYIDLYEGGIQMDGCFYDDAGMENTEGRVNQGFTEDLRQKYIDLVNFTHSKGLAAFPNQLSTDWYADTVSTANPNGLPSAIGENDYMLLESCHTQVGLSQGKPLWRHVNGTEGVWNYYENWYDKVGAKVVINDYLYGTGGGEQLSDEEKYELATYLLCDSLCCKAHYIDMNGLRTWDYPDFFDELLIPDSEDYDISRPTKGEYILHANGHTLRIVRNDNLSQGDVVNLKSLNKVFIYYDDVRIKNAFKKVAQYSYETDQRLDTIEKNIETIQTSAKSTANIYHRMMIDDWSKELVLTNYGTKNGFIKKIAEAAKTGIATVESVDYETNSIRITRLTAAQINVYLDIDITDKKGHTLEFGFTCNEVTGSNNWGYNAYAPAAITWSWINKSINTRQKSSYYGENFYGLVRTVTIPEDTEEEKWTMRICYNGSIGQTFDLGNFYAVDVDEYGEDITKDWYTNYLPKLKSTTNNNNLPIAYTVDEIDDYSFDITWNIPENYAHWSGLCWTLPSGTFLPGHTYEFGCLSYTNNAGSANVAFRLYYGSKEKYIPKTLTIKSSIYGDTRPGVIITVPESETVTNGRLTLTSTAGYQNGSGEFFKTEIREMYLYDINEENIVVRGEEPSNSFLRICRVTDEKLANDKTLLGNSMYITDSGKMFITDFNGNKTDINVSGDGIVEDYRLLPIPTAEDEGKILKVIDGKWTYSDENKTVELPDNLVLYEETIEDDPPLDISSIIKGNLSLDADGEFVYLMYGEDELSKIPLGSSSEVVRCESVKINESITHVALNQEKPYSFTATLTPADCTQTLKWSSSVPSVATISSDGVLTVLSEGETIITAKCGSQYDSITIQVINTTIQYTIDKGIGWGSSNGVAVSWGNPCRAYTKVGNGTPVNTATYPTGKYGILLKKGFTYTTSLSSENTANYYYGIQIFHVSDSNPERLFDSGWVISGKTTRYTVTQDNSYMYVNFKVSAGGGDTVTDEKLENIRSAFSITMEV